MDKTELAARMKRYEARGLSLTHILPGDTVVARLDGQSFHTFTKGMKRPYDEQLSRCMINTMKVLVDAFGADVGYTQSDEITLVWRAKNTDFMYGGRVQKLIGSLSARASVVFMTNFMRSFPGDLVSDENPFGRALPTFDCRLFLVPNDTEAVNCLIWRQQDCTKNAISMAAQSMFAHSSLQQCSGSEMQEMMWQHHGVNFNDYPAFFKRGTFARRMETVRCMTDAELAKLPEIIATARRGIPFVRRSVQEFDCWITTAGETVDERINAVFGDKNDVA